MKRLAAALIPALSLLVGDVVITRFLGRVDLLGESVYGVVMPGAALARYAGMFALAGLSWWLMRRLGAGRWWRVAALVSGPTAYAITAVWHMARWFPTGQAFYYAINPLTLAALGSSVAMVSVAEMFWRRRVVLPLVGAAVAGWGVLFGTVLWHGGVHWFYIYQQGFEALFR